jgi:hypothetical protein
MSKHPAALSLAQPSSRTKNRLFNFLDFRLTHYLTAKYLDVLEALLWGFHNARSGLCSRCAPSTVAEATKP